MATGYDFTDPNEVTTRTITYNGNNIPLRMTALSALKVKNEPGFCFSALAKSVNGYSLDFPFGY